MSIEIVQILHDNTRQMISKLIRRFNGEFTVEELSLVGETSFKNKAIKEKTPSISDIVDVEVLFKMRNKK